MTSCHVPHVGEAVQSWTGVVTLMVRNIPRRFTQLMFVKSVNDWGYEGFYDFLYLPFDRKKGTNNGYGFINFIDVHHCKAFRDGFDGAYLDRSVKFRGQPLRVSPATVQGYQANYEHFVQTKTGRKHDPQFSPLFFPGVSSLAEAPGHRDDCGATSPEPPQQAVPEPSDDNWDFQAGPGDQDEANENQVRRCCEICMDVMEWNGTEGNHCAEPGCNKQARYSCRNGHGFHLCSEHLEEANDEVQQLTAVTDELASQLRAARQEILKLKSEKAAASGGLDDLVDRLYAQKESLIAFTQDQQRLRIEAETYAAEAAAAHFEAVLELEKKRDQVDTLLRSRRNSNCR